VDADALHRFDEMLRGRIADCQREIYRFAGGEFNINSPKQLGEVLFEKLSLPAGKKTKTGYSTNVDVLEKLRDKHPIIPEIMTFRTLTKLQATYAEGLLKVIGPDGRVRTTFQNTVTATGRLSSTDPNLQNIPVRTDLGAEIRKMFVPAPGMVFVDADYSQIELRVLSHMADDKAMQDAFNSGSDIHRVTASQVFGVPFEEVTAQMRRSAKAVNFGIVYGISEFSLSEDIGVSRQEAKRYIDSYLEKYHGIRDFMTAVVENGTRDGWVATLYGRRRYLPDLKSSKYMVREAARRMAMNAPIQGTAADIIKLAMLRVREALKASGLKARLVLQVHDELIVECPEAEAGTVQALVAREMEQAASLAVPLTAEAKTGRSWYEAK
jgi:DNA polymerase-1